MFYHQFQQLFAVYMYVYTDAILKADGTLLVDTYYQLLTVNLKIPENYGTNDKRCWSSEE